MLIIDPVPVQPDLQPAPTPDVLIVEPPEPDEVVNPDLIVQPPVIHVDPIDPEPSVLVLPPPI